MIQLQASVSERVMPQTAYVVLALCTDMRSNLSMHKVVKHVHSTCALQETAAEGFSFLPVTSQNLMHLMHHLFGNGTLR